MTVCLYSFPTTTTTTTTNLPVASQSQDWWDLFQNILT